MFQKVTNQVEARHDEIRRLSENPYIAMDLTLGYMASTAVRPGVPGFQVFGDCPLPKITVILKSPHSHFYFICG